ncbi:MAG: protein kinase [Myxococcota bacterium]
MGDRYTITERLDQGGMAEVFRGVAESLRGFKKNVAIKRILPSLTKNDKFVAMFLDEAKLSLYLQHANIVQVFDIGVTDSSYFLVMEFVDGCNLKALIERIKKKGQRVEISHAIYVVIECCKALNYAHNLDNPETHEPLKIVHRDISPPNILLSKMGEVKLVDFGLAKANSQIESTDPGVVKGKFSYLAPEAASGLEVDHRADIFALGIILWEMFTSRRLFYGDTDYQTVELVRQARIPSIAAINPDIEPELEQVVRKALARDPNDRYASAADLGDALAQFLFSRRMKVTARDIAALVRETQLERMRKRSAEPKESLIDVLIQDEMAKLTSLIGDGDPAGNGTSEGASSLDPRQFVEDSQPLIDTSQWTSMMFDDDSSPMVKAPTPEPAPTSPSAQATSGTSHSENIESLQQILEPDRSEPHEMPAPEPESKATLIALIVIAVLIVALGVGLFMFKDRLLGSDASSPTDRDPATATRTV